MDDEATVREIIVKDLGWTGSPDLLTPDYHLLDNDVIDSLGIFQLISLLEERGVYVPDEELVPTNFETIGAITSLMARTRAAG
jgi:acyl carrier protein